MPAAAKTRVANSITQRQIKSLMLPLEGVYQGDPDWRTRRGLDDDTFRTSIGLEDPQDLIADLQKGLAGDVSIE